MTDEQIINALKQCGRKHNEKNDKYCKECQFKSYLPCVAFLCDRTIDLINRQKAEIERLEFALYVQKVFDLTNPKTVEEVAKYYSVNKDIIKSEAIKKFAERLKEKASSVVTSCQGYEIYETKQYNISAVDLDNLVKEMVGEE